MQSSRSGFRLLPRARQRTARRSVLPPVPPLARRAPEGQGVHRGWRFRSEGNVRAFIHQATEVPLEAKDGIWSQALGSSNRSGRADHVESTGHGQQLPASGNLEKISQTKLSSQAQEQGQTLRTGTRSDRQTSGFCFHT